MTRLELARKRAEELKGKSVKIETSNNANTSNTRLELARKRANELKQAQEKKNKQAQLAKEYIEQNGTEKINSEYNKYMQSVNKTIAPKLYQTKGMQELASKRNVITPQEVTKANVTDDKIDKYGDYVFNTALKEDWANSTNPLQRKVANNMGLKSDNSYIKDLGKESYNVIGSVGYGIGRTISKLGMKAYLNLKDEFTNLKGDIEKKQALIKKGISIQEANKIVKEEKVKRKEENQNIVNQLDRKTIQEYGNKNFIVSASNFASDMTMAILGANGMTNAGINPIVSNALAQGAKGFAEATASTTNKKDIAVDTISSGVWGAIFNGANNLLGKTGLGKVSTNKLANFGKFFLKNAISSAVASGTTQSLDIFKSNPNYDYIDWQQVEKGIQSGKYKNIEEFLDSNDYISMVTKNRASQIIMSSIITAFINTFVEYGKNPSIQQMQRQDDAYKTLGLSRNASDEEIRATYRKLAKLYHPDNSTTGNTEMFTKINEAYHTIIDSRIMSQNIQTTQPSNASQNANSSLMNLPQGDVSYLYQKYNIPKINTDIQLQQDMQNVANNKSNVSNDLNLVQNTSNNVSSKITTPTNKKQNSIPNNSNIQGLEDYTEQDIKDIVSDYIQDLDTGVKIKDIALNGSRARGNSKATSDLDVVVEYDGDMTEDSLFNELNKEPLIIDGIKVDINPITASKSGTLEEYMRKSKLYDEQQNLPQEYEESEIFEPKEEYKTTTLKDEIERYKDLPKEEMSFYDLQYNGYYEDTSLAIENYIKETYDLKEKNLNVYVEDSRVSESKYIRIEDENDEAAEIRLSTHSNNETHPDYQKQVFYNKNDSIDEVERMIDEAVKEVLKNTFKYNVEKSQQPLYNQERGGIGGKEQRRTDRTPNKNKDESKSDRQDIRDVRHKEITNEGDNEYRDFSRNWNDDNRRKNITYNSEHEESGKQRKLIDDAVIEKAFKDVINKYGITTEYKSAGYLLPDGTMTNLMDKATGKRMPHADVRFTGLDELDFIYSGAIRLLPEFGYWSMTENPTQEQLDILEKYIDQYAHTSLKLPIGFEENDTFVDIYIENGKIETFQISRYENGDTAIKRLKIFLNSIKKNSKQSSFSLSKDNQGRILSKEQQEYFKDSKVRDENGNLLTVYHGTPNGTFTVFNGGSYFTSRKDYAKVYQNTSASSISTKQESSNPKVYEVYLNIKSPFTIQDTKAKEIYLNEFIKGGNSLSYDPYTNWEKEINRLNEIDWTEAEDLKEWLEENHPEYDGLILDEGGDGGYGEEYSWRGKSFVPFNPNQIKSVDNTNPTSNPDILKEPTEEYNVQNRIRMPIKVLKSTNRISKPQVVGQRIWEGFEKQGYIDLNGKTVKNVQDVAELAQIFRNPKYETFRIIYTNRETIVGQEAITSYLPGSSKISVDENMPKAYYKIKDRMKRLDANGYYLVHNHPAGTAKASISDIRTTEKIEKNIKGFKGHVIVDHGTYAFISKDDFGMNWQDELKVDDKNALYKGSQFETNLLSNKIPWNEIQIKSRSDFASLMHNLKNSTDYSTLILCDAKEKINAIVDIPNGFFNMRQSHVEGYIRNLSKKYGAVDAFVGTSDENTFNKLQQFTNLRDSVLYQDNTKEFGNKKGNSVFDDKNSLAMRTAEETEEERKERVRKYIEETQKTIGTLGVKIDRKEIVDRIINDYGITQKGNSKELNRVSKEMQDLIERGALTDNKIEGYAEQLIDNLKVSIDDYYNANKELKELIRRTKLYVSDTVKNGFGQWEEFRKQNVGTLRLTNDIEALPVDTFYKELTETYGESIFPSDIANVSDQLEKISDVAKNIKKIDKTLRENIEDNFGEEARKEIVDGLTENFKTLREKAKQSNSNEEVSPDTEIKKRSWTKTAKKNDMVTTFLDVKDLEYVVKGNKGTVARANNTLQNEGYDESLKHFESIIESGKFPTADEVALGERLIQESIRLGKFEKAVELVSDVTIFGTELGQSVQAMSIIHKLSPAGQLMYLKRAVDRMNKTQKKKTVRKKKIDDIDTFTNAVSNNENLPKEVKNNSKLKEMVDKIVTGEQSKFKLQEEMQGKFNVNDIIGKIEKGEQEKIELPKEIRDNSNLMKLVTNIEEGEQTKLKLKKEMKDNTELGKIVTKVVEGEQSKMDLGTTNEAIAENKKFKKEKIELTPEMELAILSAQTPEELEMAVTRVKEQLAAQMPVTLSEKLAEWRYLAMLGNPKTHIRNILGNTAMIPLYEEKRFFQKVLETVFDSKLEERTTTFKKATKVVKDFANAMVTENKDTLAGNGYANIQSEIKSMRKIYKAKLLQLANEFNSNALEYEDFIFKKRVFTEILADYLTANGIKTEQDIQKNSKLIQKGINYAIEEAKKATFNQYNAVATAISRFENSSAFGRIAIGGLAPFKRTPLNIVKTSWQYSPLGLIETLSLQTHNLNNGTITPNDYIERVSQGLTGVSISLIGFLLASVGILTASGGNSKEDKYKEAIGTFAPYSIQVGTKYIDISWLAPATVPLIVGTEMYSMIKDGSKNPLKTIDDLIKVLEKTLNPISQMTMLSTFNDALINYGGDDDISGIASLIDTVIMSYIGQAFPTLGSQINRTIDPTIRSTSVSKNSSWNLGERMIRQNMNKIPGLSYLLEPSIDVWGNVRKRSDNTVLRGADAFINPASITEDSSTKVDKEILRLYKINGDNRIIPSTTIQKYFTANSIRYEMNAHEYTQYKINYGQTAYSNLKKMFSSVEYSKMSDTEKANEINKVYGMSKDIAKYRYMTDKYGEEGLKKLLDDNAYRKYTNAKKVANLTYEQYLTVYYAQTGIESDKDKNGNSISGSQTEKKIQAIQKALPRLTKQQATKLKKIFAGDLI